MPHMGWNKVRYTPDHPLFAGIEQDSHFYFVHSYAVQPNENTIATSCYGVDFSAEASRKLADIQKRDDANELGLCMVKTHLSLSDDPGVKGAPKGWKLRIRDVLTFGGAGFVVPVSGSITLMPGTGSNPSFRRVDVDVDTGRVKGIF